MKNRQRGGKSRRFVENSLLFSEIISPPRDGTIIKRPASKSIKRRKKKKRNRTETSDDCVDDGDSNSTVVPNEDTVRTLFVGKWVLCKLSWFGCSDK